MNSIFRIVAAILSFITLVAVVVIFVKPSLTYYPAYINFLLSPAGGSLTAASFATLTVFMIWQVATILRRPRQQRRLQTWGDWIAWAVIPGWKASLILTIFSHQGGF